MSAAADDNTARPRRWAVLRKFRLLSRRRLVAALLPLVCYGSYYGFYRYHLKRFQALEPGVFYRVGQPTEIGLRVLKNCYGVRTVVSLQLFDIRLQQGVFDPGEPDGRKEAEFVESLGMRHVQWTMGDEQCWPWPEPWQIEAFYELVDDPANHPIVIHCMGGRHRTGTFSALFRLEYDRWSAADALKEMYSYPFGGAVPAQQHNLLAYVPRPEPHAGQWQALSAAFAQYFPDAPPRDYRALVRAIQSSPANAPVRDFVRRYVEEDREFSLSMAARLIDDPADPAAAVAVAAARRRLESVNNVDDSETPSAAALIADFGSPAEQAFLAELVRQQAEFSGQPSKLYESLIRGLTNRYTKNRPAFLRPLVDDRRLRIEPQLKDYRYCDTLLYFLAAVTDDVPLQDWTEEIARRDGPDYVRRWFAEHPDAVALAQRVRPSQDAGVQAGDGPMEEDLSKMRR